MITDEVIVTIKAGDGGRGMVSFRREKFVARGGPDGGDGGAGGNVYFTVNRAVHTLADFSRVKDFRAQSGQPGGKGRKTGKSGDDLVLMVPPGTVVYKLGKGRQGPCLLADLKEVSQSILVARGGQGGWGNVHFATATRQSPGFAQPGRVGERIKIRLELKLIADIGIIGLPNSGKSTLLSRISSAQPKIADYPFTTLSPNLGVVKFKGQSFVAADIPGLIAEASSGKGLGFKFLRHIERTKILIHLIDVTHEDLGQDYRIVRRELQKFNPQVARKPQIITINKVDELSSPQKALKKSRGLKNPILISAVTGYGLDELLTKVASMLKK